MQCYFVADRCFPERKVSWFSPWSRYSLDKESLVGGVSWLRRPHTIHPIGDRSARDALSWHPFKSFRSIQCRDRRLTKRHLISWGLYENLHHPLQGQHSLTSVWPISVGQVSRLIARRVQLNLRLSWGSIHGSYCSNIEQVGLTGALLSVSFRCILLVNERQLSSYQ